MFLKPLKFVCLFLYLGVFSTSALSSEIRLVQKILNELSYQAGAEDGLIGPKTLNAMVRFLADKGNTFDGKIDANEIQLLTKELQIRGYEADYLLRIFELRNEKISRPIIKSQNYLSALERKSYVIVKEVFPQNITDPSITNYGTHGNIVAADFDLDGELEYFTTRSPNAYISYVFGGEERFKGGWQSAKAQSWTDLFQFFDTSNQLTSVASKNLEISGTHNCLHAVKPVVAFLNSDEIPDLVIFCSGYDASPWPGGSSYVLLSHADGKYKPKLLTQKARYAHSGEVIDVNGDNILDVVLLDTTDPKHSLYAYINDGLGNFSTAYPISKFYQGAYTVSATDLNDDGMKDLILGGEEIIRGFNGRILWNNGSGDFKNSKETWLPKPKIKRGTVVEFLVSTDHLLVIRKHGAESTYHPKISIQRIALKNYSHNQIISEFGATPTNFALLEFDGNKRTFGTLDRSNASARFSYTPGGLFEFTQGLSNFELLHERKMKVKKSSATEKICLLAVKNGKWVKSIGLQQFVEKGKSMGLDPKDCGR